VEGEHDARRRVAHRLTVDDDPVVGGVDPAGRGALDLPVHEHAAALDQALRLAP
jgi:hypothetical protein